MTTRRRLLRFGGLALVGSLSLVSNGTRTAMAADAWGTKNVTLSAHGGYLSSLEITKSDLDVALDWKGIEDTTEPVKFDVLVSDGNTADDLVSISPDAPWDIQLSDSTGDEQVDGSGSAVWDSGTHPAEGGISLIGTDAPFPSDYFTPGEYPLEFELRFEHPEISATGAATVKLSVKSPVLDSFDEAEYENVGKSLSDVYSGKLTNYQRVTSPTFGGTHALQYSTDGGAIIYRAEPGRGFKQGDTMRFDCQIDSNTGDASFYFAVHGQNGYLGTIRGLNDDVRLLRRDDGSYTRLDNTGIGSFPTSELLVGEVSWAENGEISFTVYDKDGNEIGTASATDTTYSDEDSVNYGIRTRGDSVYGNPTTVIYDNLRLI